jgi:hypothetical protein
MSNNETLPLLNNPINTEYNSESVGESRRSSLGNKSTHSNSNLNENSNYLEVNTINLESPGNFNKLIDENHSITISSDCEGVNPTSQIEKIMKAEKLIYLGDLLD